VNRILTLLFFAFYFQCATAQVEIDSLVVEAEEYYGDETREDVTGVNDSAHVETRQFSETELQSLKEDPDFDFKEAPTVAESLWDRLLRWLSDFFAMLLDGAFTVNWVKILIYGIVLAVLVVIVMMILKVDAFKIFYSGQGASTVRYDLFEENIHEIDFDAAIQNAVNKQDYRKGIRLVFLYALKMLSDKHLIMWEQGKTNHDYVGELQSGEVKAGLNELSYYFDYAWYGNFVVNRTMFEKVNNIFNTWKTTVR